MSPLPEFFRFDRLNFFKVQSAPIISFLQRALYRKQVAFKLVMDIGDGRRAWKQSDPVQKDDSDLVINASLSDLEMVISMNRKLIRALDQYASGLVDHGALAKQCFIELTELPIG